MSYTISVTEISSLTIARRLKMVVERLFKQAVSITQHEVGDLHLVQQANTSVIYKDRGIKVVADKNELLAVASHALIREFLGELPLGETVVTYQQEQRILMIDMARKYFSKEILLQFIDSMALAQFNYLQLHFSENEGFRIESEVAPEIVSDEHLTKNEIREIILYAQQAGIEIIPDFDSPGHLKQILRTHPEWQLQKKQEDGTLERDPAALNICDPEAIAFILSIYQEYAELFADSTYFHIGGDEFVDFDQIEAYPELRAYAKANYGEAAEGIDTFVSYVNQVIETISQWGFVPRIWNDGFFRLNRSEQIKLATNVEVTYWTKWNQHMAPVATFLEKDYTIINFNDNYFYYVLGENAGYSYPTYDKILDGWTPEMYAQQQVMTQLTPQLPGVALAIWCDRPEAQDTQVVWENMSYLLFAAMQKLTTVFADQKQIKTIIKTYFH